jgi:hypothetical protein
MVEQFAYNPKSGRYISTSSRLYFKLIKEGVIKPDYVAEPVAEPVIVTPEPQKPPTSLKKNLVKAAAEAISENRNQLVGTKDLTDDETDQLLKRLLYAKLCMEPAKKKKPKPKPKKRKRKKAVVVPSSSESEESSDEEASESESD